MQTKDIPAYLPPIPEDYVFLGLGGTFKYEDEKTCYATFPKDSDRGYWQDFGDKRVSGNKPGLYYAFPKDSETVKINKIKQEMPTKQIKDIPAELPPIPENYVYMGLGKTFEEYDNITPLRNYLFYKKNPEVGDPKVWGTGSGCSCRSRFYHYCFHKDSETVKLNTPKQDTTTNMTKAKTFEEKLEEAQKLVGKTVLTPSGIKLKISHVDVVVKGCGKSSGSMELLANKEGYAIGVVSGGFVYPYDQVSVVGDAVVNGYTADFSKVKSENIVVFGCAKIDKNIFITLAELIDDPFNGNRYLENETYNIGRGVFTKEQISEISERIKQILK